MNTQKKTQNWIACLVVLSGVFAWSAVTANEEATTLQYYEELTMADDAAFFVPPKNWKLASPNALPDQVVMLATGAGKKEVPPTLNLATEDVDLSLGDYLRAARELHRSQGHEWKDLGTIQTQAGLARLAQTSLETRWGKARLMQAIVVQNKKAYVLTASALQDEFSDHYEDFFDSLRSFEIKTAVR